MSTLLFDCYGTTLSDIGYEQGRVPGMTAAPDSLPDSPE